MFNWSSADAAYVLALLCGVHLLHLCPSQLVFVLQSDGPIVIHDDIEGQVVGVVPRQQLTAALGSADLDVWSTRVIESSTADPIEVHLNGTNATITYESAMEVGAHPIPYQHDSTGADYHQLVRSRHTDTWTRSDGTSKHLRAETAAVSSTAQ